MDQETARKIEMAAEAFVQAKQWTSMQTVSVDLKELLKEVGQTDKIEIKVEDDTYLRNALE